MMTSSRHRHQRTQGNTLAEYALGTVVTVAMLVTSLTSIDVPQLLEDIMTDTMNGNVSSGALTVRSYGIPMTSSSIQAAADRIAPPAAGEEQICFDSNICVNIPVGSEISGVETTGSNGSQIIHRLAAIYDQLAEQLDVAGADPEVIALVVKLANQGHRLGETIQDSADQFELGGITDTRSLSHSISTERNTFIQYKQDLDGFLSSQREALVGFETSKSIIDLEYNKISSVTSRVSFDTRTDTFSMPGADDFVHQSANEICDQSGTRSCWWRADGSSELQLASGTSSAS